MRIITTVAIAGMLGMAGCSSSSTSADTSKPTNSQIEQSIKAQFSSNPQLADHIKVDADAANNLVTLSGTVYTEPDRTQALSLAKSAQNGISVIDKIDVKPGDIPRSEYTEQMASDAREKAKSAGDKIGSSLDDAWIHTKLESKLIGDPQTPVRKINIDVDNGIVTLRGDVPSADAKAEAQRIAGETDGVKRVNNLLRVRASG